MAKESKDEKVYTTKDLALALNMNGKQLRRKLRAMDKYNDGTYTRYAWTKKDYDRLVKQLSGKKEDKQEKEVETK
jgi:epoxyqueuosine reductase QueG